jgi:hypothetical protein
LKIDARLAADSPLYVMTLEGLSIVAALRELAWQLAVTLSESCLHEAEYAATLVEVLCPMAMTAQLLPPGACWNSHATLCLHTETRTIEGSEQTEDIVLIEFRTHDLELSHEKLQRLSPPNRARLIEAYEEETAITRALDGFVGDGAAMLERLRGPMECGAMLARAQLFYHTAHRAEIGLHSLYTEDPIVRKRVEKVASWFMRLQSDERRPGISSKAPSVCVTQPGRMH